MLSSLNTTLPLPFGSLTTIAAARLSPRGNSKNRTSEIFEVKLSDGSLLKGEVDLPQNQKALANILLIHGLASSAHDPSVVRQARFLARKGFRVYRLNHRNAGAGKNLATGFYHADRSLDILESLEALSQTAPESKWILVGHSLSGNMVLKLAGNESLRERMKSAQVQGIVALSPIVDLEKSSKKMTKPLFGAFDKMFTKTMSHYLKKIPHGVSDELKQRLNQVRNLAELDEIFVAPALGLKSAKHYYERASAKDLLESISLPSEIISAKDDPIAPGTLAILNNIKNPKIKVRIHKFGGHLGFLGIDVKRGEFQFLGDHAVANACQNFAELSP